MARLTYFPRMRRPWPWMKAETGTTFNRWKPRCTRCARRVEGEGKAVHRLADAARPTVKSLETRWTKACVLRDVPLGPTHRSHPKAVESS
jgi:hypothetical protein